MNEREQYVKDRDIVLLKCDVDEFRKFNKKYAYLHDREFLRALDEASDYVLEMTLHKMIVSCTKMPLHHRKRSENWLTERNMLGGKQ